MQQRKRTYVSALLPPNSPPPRGIMPKSEDPPFTAIPRLNALDPVQGAIVTSSNRVERRGLSSIIVVLRSFSENVM